MTTNATIIAKWINDGPTSAKKPPGIYMNSSARLPDDIFKYLPTLNSGSRLNTGNGNVDAPNVKVWLNEKTGYFTRSMV
jgi:hypothetical protein